MLDLLFDGRRPSFWAVIATLAIAMNATALYFQYGLNIQPCVLCIDIRISLYLVTLLGIITALLNPNSVYFHSFRILTFSSITYSAYLAFDFYSATTSLNPLAITCSLDPNLPQWLPLHKWIPTLFEAQGMCSETNWKLMNIGLVQWSMIGCLSLAIYSVLGLLRLPRLILSFTNNLQ
jgi:disulfide bond formation protein DsbB